MATAKNDLLVLNTESSEDLNKALGTFLDEMEQSRKNNEEDIYDAQYGFTSGFWAATKILTGYKAEWE